MIPPLFHIKFSGYVPPSVERPPPPPFSATRPVASMMSHTAVPSVIPGSAPAFVDDSESSNKTFICADDSTVVPTAGPFLALSFKSQIIKRSPK